MSAIINVLASIGLVAILIVIIYYIWKYIDQLNKETELTKTRPSNAYMQSIGVKCPDYWTLINTDQNGNYICRDNKNLMELYGKSSNSQCVSTTTVNGISSKVAYFSKLDDTKSWDEMSDDERIDFMKKSVDNNKYSRAEWIKNCGPQVGSGVSTQAIWSGLNKYI